MATYTSKLNLKKPEGNELFNRAQDLNDNWDKIDAHAHDDAYYTEAEVDSLLITKVDKETGKSLVSDATLLDLTDGNETTLHKHNASNTPFTPTGNLSSTNVQNALAELDSEKANKVQETWITPTLLNGATNGAIPVRYRKDQFGVVYFEGVVTVISGEVLLLPAGYRRVSGKDFRIPVISATGTTIGAAVILINQLYVTAGTFTLNNLRYFAEA